ncbi:hypothetical protein L618_004000000320 [Rhodococcus rhodochrous J45]|uniref:Uncharacterized protein n=1 Tax=Rhodococcus rhodochrous J45 TaxID=935266 RepID=A0A562DLF0_RHORH|nr:hypothetical protein L618_004000000320 [Rhodococcus rhodochrous J45]
MVRKSGSFTRVESTPEDSGTVSCAAEPTAPLPCRPRSRRRLHATPLPGRSIPSVAEPQCDQCLRRVRTAPRPLRESAPARCSRITSGRSRCEPEVCLLRQIRTYTRIIPSLRVDDRPTIPSRKGRPVGTVESYKKSTSAGFARLDSRTRPRLAVPTSELGERWGRVLPARRPDSDTSPRKRCPASFDLRHEEATDQQRLNHVAKRRRGVSATLVRQALGRLSGHTLLDGHRRSGDQRSLALARRCATVTTKTHRCMPRPTPLTGTTHSSRTRTRNTASTIAHVRSIAGTTVLITPRRNDAAVPVVPIDVLQIRSFLVCA